MQELLLLGRILFALLFVSSGLGHFAAAQDAKNYAAYKGVPFPGLAVKASGALFLAGGVSVALGAWADLGALVLLVALVPTTLMMHRFWKEAGEAVAVEKVSFLKNTSIAGGALTIYVAVASGLVTQYTLTDSAFTLS